MSSTPENENIEVVLAEALFVSIIVQAVNAALIIYDFVLTIEEAKNLIGSHKIIPSFLFVSNQLVLLSYAIINILGILSWNSGKSCAAIQIGFSVLYVIMIGISATIAALRLYAVSGKNWPLAAFVLALGLVPFGTNLAGFYDNEYDLVVKVGSFSTCDEVSNFPQMELTRMLIAARTCTLASDVIVLVVTWIKMHCFIREYSELHSSRPTFSGLLLRDGTFYFIAIFLLNAIVLIIDFVPGLGDVWFSVVVILYTMPSIFVSRFLLSINEVEYATTLASIAGTQSSNIAFASVNEDDGIEELPQYDSSRSDLDPPITVSEQRGDANFEESSVENAQIELRVRGCV